ncbi:pseudouridine synthase [Candidatus Woesearchaeota archaeon]|nr:pseudouridine synthase [Candidatus Woesearchaeota archaeon]
MAEYRVQKLLSNYGYCSRRKAEKLIEEGRVKVNGETISIGDKASENDDLTVDGKPVSPEKKVYLMLNKPHGCVTALTDSRYKTVMSCIDVKERVFPIGRLDYNTTGLLLLTNDGDFANKVMHPRYEIKKTYLVEIDKPITSADIKKIESGVRLEDGKTSKSKINAINPKRVEITIHEGKNRIVRRIFKHLGYKVERLKRIMIGKLRLGSLEPGEYKLLSSKQMQKIFE